MSRLEDLTPGALVHGVLADRAVRVVEVEWHDTNALTLTDDAGHPGQELFSRADEARLSVDQAGRAWPLDTDGIQGTEVAKDGTVTGRHGAGVPERTAPLPSRFHGRVTLDTVRLLSNMCDIAAAVIDQLSSAGAGADVTVTVEIEGQAPRGFSDELQRTVTENARTLEFDTHQFEADP